MYAPIIEDAAKAGETVLNNGLIAVTLANIRNDRRSRIEYGHLLVLFACGQRDPVAFIASEKSAASPQWLLCHFTASGHGNCGEDPRLSDLVHFQKRAIEWAEYLCAQGEIAAPAIRAQAEELRAAGAPRAQSQPQLQPSSAPSSEKTINLAVLGLPLDELSTIIGAAMQEVGDAAPMEVMNTVLARRLRAHGVPEASIAAYLRQFDDLPPPSAPASQGRPGLFSRMFGKKQ